MNAQTGRPRKGSEKSLCKTNTVNMGTEPPYMHNNSRSRFGKRSGIKWELERHVMHPTSRELLEEQITETAREVLSAALKNYYKQHKILNPIYVILVQEFQGSDYIYSLGKGILG